MEWQYILGIVIVVCITIFLCYAIRQKTKIDIIDEINELKVELAAEKEKEKVRQPTGPSFSYKTTKYYYPKEKK